LIAVSLVLLIAVAARSPVPADLVLLTAKIWTGDAERPQAEALAVREGRIIAVGRTREIEALAGPATRIVQGRGRRVVPGLIDSHTHMSMGGFNPLAVVLRHT
jgi:predicted amidohydrolase YtcJ